MPDMWRGCALLYTLLLSYLDYATCVITPGASLATGVGRRLLQEPGELPAAPQSAPNTTRSNVIEGGISVDRCIASNVLSLYSGAFLLPDVFALRDSKYDCCALCVETSDCFAWDYCTSREGCKLPDVLVKVQSPLQIGGAQVVVPVNGSGAESPSLPYGACVLTSRLPSIETTEAKEFGGDGRQYGFFSATIDRQFLPYLSGFKASQGKNISSEYDFPCGYSPKKQRCEIIGTIPEVASICSSDPRCGGFVYSDAERMGVLKGGEGARLFSEEDYVDDLDAVVYILTPRGQLARQQGVQETSSSSPSNLWIILISVLGGVAILSTAAVTVTMILLSRRCHELQKSSESYYASTSACDPRDIDTGPDEAGDQTDDEVGRDRSP